MNECINENLFVLASTIPTNTRNLTQKISAKNDLLKIKKKNTN